MTNPAPPCCTYCGATSSWSAERTEATELAETHTCPECDQQTGVWPDSAAGEPVAAADLPWAAPEPLQ